VKHHIDNDRFPEWQPFVEAVQQRGPDAGTWCEAWTVRDIVVHQAGNAEELARVLGAHLAGEPVATRRFEERQAPLREMNETDLWAALHRNMAVLSQVTEAAADNAPADNAPADTDVAWTGRTMKVPWFAEHMRGELVLHGWDITGDDAAAQSRMAQPWMTTHSVLAVGKPLLVKGVKQLRPGERIEARLRVDGADDVVVSANSETTTIELADPDGPAILETDSAARVLLLWGRRPADPSRVRSRVGPEVLGRVRALLSGY
jgi:Mycothiol maleylpyruvate isomerase N-terminal domain